MKKMNLVASGILTLALVAAPATFVVDNGMPTVKGSIAKAEPGNGNGHGPGGVGNGNGNAGGNGNGGNGFGNSSNSGFGANSLNNNVQTIGYNHKGKQVGQLRADFARTWASRFANLNAFRGLNDNAAKTSNVGLIATFAANTLALQTQGPVLQGQIDGATNTLTGYGLTPDDIETYTGMTVEQIQAALDDPAALTGVTTATAAEIEAALSNLESAQTQLTNLQIAADTAFTDAAKKDSSPEVRAELENQLGLGQ